MLKTDKETLRECARNLKFELEEEQLDLLVEEFDSIIAQMSYLGEIEGIDKVDPLTFPIKEHKTFLAEDEPLEPLANEEALANTKNKLGNQVKIPKVL